MVMARSATSGVGPVARMSLKVSVKHLLPSYTNPLHWTVLDVLVLHSQRLLSFVSRRWVLLPEFICAFVVHTTTALCSARGGHILGLPPALSG